MNGPPARAAVALVILFGSAACGSLFENKSEPVAVYLLSATLAMPPAAIAADLQMRRPKVRTGLNSDHIAVLYPDHHLDFYAGARWSGPLDEVVRDLELQAFRAGSGLRSVSEDGSHFGGYWIFRPRPTARPHRRCTCDFWRASAIPRTAACSGLSKPPRSRPPPATA